MPTILKARGHMTRDIITQYEAGQQVLLVNPDEASRERGLVVGAVGLVRKIIISDANDGDETFLMFYVRFDRFTWLIHGDEIVPVANADAHLWARRQLDALGRA